MLLHRVGDRNKYEIHLPLPPKIDPTVTMMQVSGLVHAAVEVRVEPLIVAL